MMVITTANILIFPKIYKKTEKKYLILVIFLD